MKKTKSNRKNAAVPSGAFLPFVVKEHDSMWGSDQVLNILKQNTEESFLIADRDLKIVSFNKSFGDLYTNYLNKELIDGTSILDYTAPERRDIIVQIFGNALKGEIQKTEIEYTKANGDLIYYHNSFKPAIDLSGDIVGVIVIATDVSEQKRIERIVEKSELKFRSVIEYSSEMFFLSDKDLNFVYMSPSVEKIMGFNTEDIIGKRGMSFILPEYREEMISISQQMIQNPGVLYPMVSRMKCKDGRLIWIEGTTVNLLGDPDIASVVTNFKDITQRKHSEENMLKLNDQLKASQHIAHLGYWEIDIQGEGHFLSEEMLMICEKNVNDPFFTVQDFRKLIHPDDCVLFDINFKNALEHGLAFQSEYRLVMADGRQKIVLSNGAILYDEFKKTKLLEGTLQDVTQLKKTELSLKVLNEKLQQRALELSNSNAELEQFAYVASHDLQEPLRMISSFLSQLEKKYADKLDARAKQYIHFATDGAIRMRQIIIDLLEFSKLGKNDQGPFEAVDLNELLQEIIELNKVRIKEINAIIHVDFLPKVSIRKPLLRQVFQNLISNALKYSNTLKRAEINICVSVQPDYWIFSVKDNGIGINPKFFDKIFILFQRLHNREEYSGTGIGLALCKKIVEGNGGKIWLESEEGKGATFFFTLNKRPISITKKSSE